MSDRKNIEDTKPIDLFVQMEQWRKLAESYKEGWERAMQMAAKHFEDAATELARLREIESQAKAAGFIGPDGKVVRFEKQYWRADADGDPCDDLEVLAEACEDGVMLEVVPILILPREWHVVEVAADGTGTTRPPTPEETEARKKAEQEWRSRARTLPTQPKTAREGNQ